MYNLPDDFDEKLFNAYMGVAKEADPELYEEAKRLELQIEQIYDLFDTAQDIGHDAITNFIHARLEELEGELNEVRDEIDEIENEENWVY